MTRDRILLMPAMALLHGCGLALAWDSLRDLHHSDGVIFYGGTGFLALAILRPGPRMAVVVATYVTGLFAGGACVLMLTGAPTTDSIRLSGDSLLHGAVMAACYQGIRHILGSTPRPQSADRVGIWRARWVPHRAADLVALMLGSVLATLGVAGWAGIWGQTAGIEVVTTPWPWLFAAALTAWGIATVGLSLLGSAKDTFQPRQIGTFSLLSLATIGLTYFALGADAVAFNWTLVLPSLLAGSLLTPWATAAHCLVLSISAVVISKTTYAPRPSADYLADNLILGGLVAACTGTAIVLSLTRHLRRQVEVALMNERQDALDQTAMLRVVLSSMSDGVVVTSHQGEPEFHNAAAARIMEMDSRTFDATTLPAHIEVLSHSGEVVPAPESGFLGAARAVGGDRLRLRVHRPAHSRARVVEVEYAGLRISGRDRYVVLIRDLTEQLDREAAMSSFAATAAHDLKAPLTAVGGWVETAYGELPHGHPLTATLRGVLRDSETLREHIDRLLLPPD